MKTPSWMIVPLVLSIGMPAFADPPAPNPSGDHARPLHRMKGKVLRERVGLNEAKAARVEAILEKYAPERKKMASKMKEARQKLQALVEKNSTDQATYRALLDQIRGNRKGLQDLMERAFTEIARDLTPSEQARLFLALDQMRGKMKGRGHGRGHDDD